MPLSDWVEEDVPVVDDAALVRLRALAEDVGDVEEDVVGELLRTFREDAERRIVTFTGAVTAGRTEDAADAVHALKGASSTIGARRLAALCAALERTARQGDLTRLPEGEALLAETLAAALAALERGLSGPG